jgi:dienelactone hydrolase
MEATMSIHTRSVDYDDGGTPLQGMLVWNDAYTPPRPCMLVAHAWAGRDAFAEAQAYALAELGYSAFALDMYGKDVCGGDPERNAQLMQPFMDDRSLLQRRMTLALKVARQQPEIDHTRVAAMGFCFGGLCVLDLARTGADLAGVVSFHGLLHAPSESTGKRIRASILVLHGTEDPMAPMAAVSALKDELTAAGADFRIHLYGHAMHSFTNPEANNPARGTVYEPRAQQRSWRALLDFLQEIFPEVR